MPYTKEELQQNEYYQNLKDADEQAYLARRDYYKTQFYDSAEFAANDGSLVVRDENGTMLLFENPYTGELYDDETTVLTKTLETPQYRINDDILEEVIDRNIIEL
jgi:uncharacterized phage-like protein YoqJ|tara:strand:- start:599 stop:913 length:315 start_codon:yes stop_codon:yes gene_type:complete